MILFILLNIIYLFNYRDKMGRGGSVFSLPPPPMGVGIPLPTPKLSGTHEFPLPLPLFLR